MWFAYDGTQVVQEFTHDEVSQFNAVTAEYVWAGSRLLLAKDGTNLERVVHVDRLGSVVLETRSNAGTVEVRGEAAYDPYGRKVTAWTWGDDALEVAYGFAGARREVFSGVEVDPDGDGATENAGLYLMGARWYDPELGRFIEQDPIGESGGLNLYAYVGSSPTMWVDPTGLAPEAYKRFDVETSIQAALNADPFRDLNNSRRQADWDRRDGEVQGAAAQAAADKAQKAQANASSASDAGSKSSGASNAKSQAQAGAAKPLKGDNRTDEERKMLDDPEVREGVQKAWKSSLPEEKSEDRQEVAFVVVEKEGDYDVGSSGLHTRGNEARAPAPRLDQQSNGTPKADIHTHPSEGQRGRDEQTGNIVPHLPKGVSSYDKSTAASRGLPVYVVGKKSIERFDPQHPGDPTVVLKGKAFEAYMGR